MTLSTRAFIVPTIVLLALTLLLAACQPSDPPAATDANGAASDATSAPADIQNDSSNDTSEPSTDAASDDKQMVGTDTAAESHAANTEETNTTDEPCSLLMGWDPWEPYHYAASDGQTRGMDVDFAQAMAEGAGCEVSFERGEWAQLIKDLQAGRIDMLAGATRVQERESFASFSDPYRTESFRLHVANGDAIAGNDLLSLVDAGFRLGLTDGYIYGNAISAIQDNPLTSGNIIYAPIAEYHFDNLAEGKIDGFLEDPYVAEAIARRQGWENRIRALPISFGSHDVHFMFSRSRLDQDTINRLNTALLQLQGDGTSAEILNRYLASAQ
ncbi:MAG: transporter substrate-binding domain-containing protein [Xanthomonadales bacterium]|nr:transporter substrate-binding domain-containing protein [Xanthomonadales bacterium]